MLRVRVCLLCVAIGVLMVLPLAAQEGGGDLARVSTWTVDDAAAFEAGLKAHNDFHRSHDDPSAIHTFEIITGKNAGRYMRASFGHTYADFDAEAAMMAEDAADSAQHLEPYVTHVEPALYRFLPEISRLPEGGISPLARVLVFEVTWGRADEFLGAIAKIHAAIGELDEPGAYIWYELVDGGSVPTFVASLPRENWAGFAGFEPEDVGKAVMARYGADGASVFEAMESSVESEVRYTIAYRADLSYVPATAGDGGASSSSTGDANDQ